MYVVMPPPAPNMASPSTAPWSAKEAKAVARAAEARIKELRPWYLKKRYIFAIVVLVVIGFAIANSQGSNGTVSGVDNRIGSAEASSDVGGVVLGQRDAVGFRAVTVTVTNSSSKRSNYMIDLSIESPDGATQYDTTFAWVIDLEPGQVTTVHALPITKAIPENAIVKINTVSRRAAD